MSDPNPRFAPQNKTVHDRLSTNTVGLVALSDFRKRRAEALEQQEREAREAATATPPDRSQTATPSNNNNNATNSAAGSDTNSKDDQQNQRKKKKAKVAKSLVSFGGDEEGEDDGESLSIKPAKSKPKPKPKTSDENEKKEDTPDGVTGDADDAARSGSEDPQKKITPNPSAVIVPRALTKSALRKEAAEKEALRKEFLLLQAAVKATEIAIPFVFYDGTSTPGGIVRVKKGDHVWLFLDKSRKVGAQLRVGAEKSVNYRRDWARVSVDDLILVRGTIIVPHHYEFYYFIMNQTKGPRGQILFDYSADAPPNAAVVADSAASLEDEKPSAAAEPGLSKPKKAGSGGGGVQVLTDIRSLEGWADDPTFTKVVDRRWYQRNKHIYPASTWQNFDPEKDYQSEIKRDTGGNAFFFGK